MEYLVLLVMVGVGIGVVFYLVSKYKAMGLEGQSAFFGLPKDDPLRFQWVGEIDSDMSGHERLAREVATGVVNWLGADTDFRPKGVSVGMSRKGRLSIVLEMPDRTAKVFVHEPGEARLRVVGRGARSVQGGPSVRYTVHSDKLDSLPIMLHENASQYLSDIIE